jgi:hypothetical protein
MGTGPAATPATRSLVQQHRLSVHPQQWSAMGRGSSLTLLILLMLMAGVLPPPSPLDRMFGPSGVSGMRHGEINHIFNNVLTLKGRPEVTVLASETSAGGVGGLEALETYLDMDRVCIKLAGGVAQFCKDDFPDKFANMRSVPLTTPVPAKKRREDICKGMAARVPSFCRLDAKEFHSCRVRSQVLLLENVYVDTGGDGRESGSVFTEDGSVFPTDSYKGHHSLPMLKKDAAEAFLARAKAGVTSTTEGGGVVDIDEMIYGMTTYNAIFYHAWREVLPMILYTLAHAPSTAAVLANAGFSGMDIMLGEVHNIGPMGGCSKRKEKLGECVVHAELVPRLMYPTPNTVYKVKRLYLPWFESQSTAVGSDAEWRSADETTCSWYQALPADIIRENIWKWIGSDQRGPTKLRPRGKSILIVHRNETTRRQVKNQADLMAGIKQSFPEDNVVQFVGKDYTIKESFALFRSIDIVIAPHGAALVFGLAMKPGSSLIELQFEDGRRNSHLTYDFFRLTAGKLGVNYMLSICNGTYTGGLKADVNDVVSLVRHFHT